MFESVMIKPTGGMKVDFGRVIESMLYYQRVIVRITRSDIPILYYFDEIGILEDLLARPELTIVYDDTWVALAFGPENMRAVTLHSSGRDYEIDHLLFVDAYGHTGDLLKSKKFAKKFSKSIKQERKTRHVVDLINQEIKEGDFLRKVVTVSQKQFANPEEVRYEIEYLNNSSFKIHTNLPPTEAHGKTYPEDSPIFIVADALTNLYLMGSAFAEIIIPEYDAKFLRIKSADVMRSVIKSQDEIKFFNHYVFDQSRALRDAINLKQVDLKSVLKVLDKAAQFKNWLSNLDNDKNLMREYTRKIEEKSILESLPVRALRYYFLTGFGTLIPAVAPAEIGIPLTVAVTAFDNFLLEKFGKRWKPNQFIENECRPLLKTKPA